MATTTQSAPPIDPAKTAKYPIALSPSLLHPDQPRKRQKIAIEGPSPTSPTTPLPHHELQLTQNPHTVNHPPPTLSTQPSLLKPTPQSPTYTLSTPAPPNKSTHTYTGTSLPPSPLLLYSPATQSFTLTKPTAHYALNLTSTPTNSDPHSLARQHPHLSPPNPDSHSDSDDLFGDDGDEATDLDPDPNNPYDYRHFLRQGSPSPEASVASSPMPNHHISSPLIASSPVRSSRPSRPRERMQRPSYLSPRPREEVRGPRRQQGEDGDSDELVIDMGDAKEKPWRSALGVLNERGGSGPISLRSAASSMSPDVEEIDLGESRVGFGKGKGEEEGKDEEGGGDGGDNEGDNGWDDDDDDDGGDLEAELENAMLEQEAGNVEGLGISMPETVVAVESSSESEEE